MADQVRGDDADARRKRELFQECCGGIRRKMVEKLAAQDQICRVWWERVLKDIALLYSNIRAIMGQLCRRPDNVWIPVQTKDIHPEFMPAGPIGEKQWNIGNACADICYEQVTSSEIWQMAIKNGKQSRITSECPVQTDNVVHGANVFINRLIVSIYIFGDIDARKSDHDQPYRPKMRAEFFDPKAMQLHSAASKACRRG